MPRIDGRTNSQTRTIQFDIGVQKFSLGSVLVRYGDTAVLCSANIEEKVPQWLNGRGQGWLTAEYSMLPGCSAQRVTRDRTKVGGRTHEIQRLIGRSLRTCIDLKAFGERSLLVDCDTAINLSARRTSPRKLIK